MMYEFIVSCVYKLVNGYFWLTFNPLIIQYTQLITNLYNINHVHKVIKNLVYENIY